MLIVKKKLLKKPLIKSERDRDQRSFILNQAYIIKY